MKDLAQCRAEIDVVDRQIIKLFEERMEICKDVVRYKMANDLQIFDASREQAILDALAQKTTPEMLPYTQELWRTLMTLSKQLQQVVVDTEGK